MKLPKTMIILGQIQQVTEQTMTDKRDATKVSKMFLVVISDKTKPSQFRCSTPFCMFLQEEKFRSIFGAGDPQDLVDENVTLAVAELAPYNAFLKVKGQILKDHLTTDHLRMLQSSGEPKQSTPAPAKSPPKA